MSAVEDKLRMEPELTIAEVTNEAYQETIRTYLPESLSAPNANTIPEAMADIMAGGDNLYNNQPPDQLQSEWPFDGLSPTPLIAANRTGNLGVTTEQHNSAERTAAVRGLLVSGIIDYLIGRRRRRIKTERQLIPIQKKLEREVLALRSTIAVKETQLRQLVKEKAHPSEAVKLASITSELPMTRQTNESVAAKREQHSKETVNQKDTSAEVISHNKLLEISEKIVVGATTLRKVFETGLVSERGLRRIVGEHLRGGNIQPILTEELLIKERGYELDPLFRDRPPSAAAQTVPSPTDQSVTYTEVTATMTEQSVSQDDLPESHRVLPFKKVERRSAPQLLVAADVTALVILVVLVLILLVIR